MQDFHKEVLRWQDRVNDWTDEPGHQLGRQLEKDMQRLEDDVQVNKSAHSIRDSLKRLRRLVEQAGDAEVMSHHHADEVIDWIDDSLRKIR